MRLRHSNASGRGYRRVRAGKGFSYRDLEGSTLPPGPVRDRLESIGIPPAWKDVWIAPFENGHIQATGVDAVGRRQYIYHPEWRERKDRLKFDRALQLATMHQQHGVIELHDGIVRCESDCALEMPGAGLVVRALTEQEIA